MTSDYDMESAIVAESRIIKLHDGFDESIRESILLRPKCQRAILEESIKLKEDIHLQIKNLHDALNERELQLYHQIDEKCCDLNMSINCQFTDLYTSAANKQTTSDGHCACKCFNNNCKTFLNESPNARKMMQFFGDCSMQLKVLLRTFGNVEFAEFGNQQTLNSLYSEDCTKSIPIPKKSVFKRIADQTSRIMNKKAPSSIRSRSDSNESIDSITSFEIIERYGKRPKDGEEDSLCSESFSTNTENYIHNIEECSIMKIADIDPTLPFREQLQRLRKHQVASDSSSKNYETSEVDNIEKMKNTSNNPSSILLKQLNTIMKDGNEEADCIYHKITDAAKILIAKENESMVSCKADNVSAIVRSSFDQYFKSDSKEWLCS